MIKLKYQLLVLIMKTTFLTLTLSFLCLYSQAHPGIGIVFDGKQTIYYTDLNHIWKLDTQTGTSEIYVEDIHTHELFLDKNGNLYGEHYWYIASEQKFKNIIWRVDKDGDFKKIRAEQYGENYNFSFTRNEAFASYEIRKRDDIYEIVKKDSLSEQVLHTANLMHPTWKYLTKNEVLLFIDFPSIFSADTNSITKLAEDISSTRLPFSMQRDVHNIYGIWTDASDNIYVAIYGGREIKKIDTSGDVTSVLKSSFLWSPVNGCFDNDGNLWLMECKVGGAIRVRKVNQSELKGEASFFIENSLITGGTVLLIALLLLWIKRKKHHLTKYK